MPRQATLALPAIDTIPAVVASDISTSVQVKQLASALDISKVPAMDEYKPQAQGHASCPIG